jgi:hypothetical protein
MGRERIEFDVNLRAKNVRTDLKTGRCGAYLSCDDGPSAPNLPN